MNWAILTIGLIRASATLCSTAARIAGYRQALTAVRMQRASYAPPRKRGEVVG